VIKERAKRESGDSAEMDSFDDDDAPHLQISTLAANNIKSLSVQNIPRASVGSRPSGSSVF